MIDRNLNNLDYRLTVEQVRLGSPVAREEFTRACRTNLRFLVNCVLRPGSSKFQALREGTHGQLFDSFLVPRLGQPYDEWSPIKERVTLAFRGALKSTLVGGFLTQVILCDPDIRILILSGKLTHAKTIMNLARQPFLTNEVIRYLFGSRQVGGIGWEIEPVDLYGDFFVCPRRNPKLNLRDPTIAIGSFDSVKAGGHHELVILDDCTNEINCATPELVEKNEEHYDDTDPLVEPGGYRHFFGTSWAPPDMDLPEVIRQRGEAYAVENGFENTTYTALPVWTLKNPDDEEVLERDRKNTLRPEDVMLAWPEKITSKYLWPKYRANPRKFNGQYLLRWRGIFFNESFTRELLLANTRPFAEGAPLPHDRFLAINWDLGGIYAGRRAKRVYDYSCGLAGMFELSTRRLFLYDAFMEVFSSSTDAATAIVQFFARQLKIGPVGVCRIENMLGVRMLEGEINSIAKQLQVPIQILWDPPDNQAGAKEIGITMLAGAMKRGLVQFATNIPHRDELFKEFESWTAQAQRVKDDGPDCAAQMWQKYNGQIFPNAIGTLGPSGNEFTWEPLVAPEVDAHADERENADLALLASMTVPHVER